MSQESSQNPPPRIRPLESAAEEDELALPFLPKSGPGMKNSSEKFSRKNFRENISCVIDVLPARSGDNSGGSSGQEGRDPQSGNISDANVSDANVSDGCSTELDRITGGKY